ncbi:MAG TPA: NmrA family NAD(P)-binding protein [Stellaceae bacterium]
MYAVVGITGQVGGAVARTLLAQGEAVRAVVRNEAKAAHWAERGVDLVRADLTDAATLGRAFAGVDGAFVMLPANFDPAPGLPEVRAINATLVEALRAAKTPKVVALSSIGAERTTGLGLITQLHLLEEALDGLETDRAYLRAGWFMENAAWDVAPARQTGALQSFLQPLDRAIPMVATADVGATAADALTSAAWTGRRVIEVAGPRRYAPTDLAASLGRALGRPVEPVVVPRERWEGLFREQGAVNPAPRIEMLDGFNSGWIDFGVPGAERVSGRTALDEVVARLVRTH